MNIHLTQGSNDDYLLLLTLSKSSLAGTETPAGLKQLFAKRLKENRIEERNLSIQPYYRSDVGAFKAKILANNLYRAIGTKVEADTKELTSINAAQLLKESGLIIDVFDNSTSRQVVQDYADQTGISCLHAGLSADYAEVIWNGVYRVPSDVNDDVCDYPLARNLVMLTVAVACEAILQRRGFANVSFVATGEQQHFTIALKDLSVQSLNL